MISHRALPIPKIVIGVDTHKDQHVAAMINKLGAHIGRLTLPTTDKGYAALEQWAKSQGEIEAFGIEVISKMDRHGELSDIMTEN